MSTPARQRQGHGAGAYALLALAIAASSSSAVLVRYADAPAVSLAFWRTAAGAVLLAPAAAHAARRAGTGAAGAPGRLAAVVGLAGVGLAVHFATWLASLDLTSVAASVTLVSTAPVFVAGWLAVTGRRPAPRAVAAIALAVAGTVVITGGDALADDQSAAGDGLALAGAAAMAVYLLAGARARAALPTTVYASATYAVAATCLLPVVLASGRALIGYPPGTWLAIAGMVVGPQLGGHTVFNHLLGRLGAVTVSLALLAEPVGAAVLTWVAFGEVPATTVWVGAPIVLAGLALHTVAGPRPTGERRRVARPGNAPAAQPGGASTAPAPHWTGGNGAAHPPTEPEAPCPS